MEEASSPAVEEEDGFSDGGFFSAIEIDEDS